MPGSESDKGGEGLAGLAAGGVEALGDEVGGNVWGKGPRAICSAWPNKGRARSAKFVRSSDCSDPQNR